jgi:nucleoside 2-deoxyribosyltransferase
MDTHMIKEDTMKYVFLSGPILNTEDGGKSWRRQVYKYVYDHEWRLKVFDPDEFFDYNWDNQYQKSDRQIREYYFHWIKKAEVVLVNLNGTDSSIGTGCEVTYANCYDVPVVGWGTKYVYPWIRDMCTVVFDTLEEALGYLSAYYDLE